MPTANIMGGFEFIEASAENVHINEVLLINNNSLPSKKVDSSLHVPSVGESGGYKPQKNTYYVGDGDFNLFFLINDKEYLKGR